MNQKYICNGKIFASFDDVVTYCEEKNFRVTNAQTVSKNIFLITVTSLK